MKIGIEGIATAFIGEALQLKAVLESRDFPNDQRLFYESLGIENLHVNDQLESYDLAKSAFQRLLQEQNIRAIDVDLIIYIRSRIPQYLVSSEATRLQYEIGCKNAITYALSDLGCADISMALKMAHDYLVANINAKHVVIAYGCKSTTQSRFRFPVTVNGDGGMATLVSRTSGCYFNDFNFRTNGKYWDLFKIDFRTKHINEYTETCIDERKYWFELALESREAFTSLQQAMFQKNNISPSDIQHYIIQNISLGAYEYYETAFDITISPVCKKNLKTYGHLGSFDIIINLHEGISTNTFKKDEKVLILNNSPSAVWSCILLTI